jgi:hypothetical protein
MTIGPYEAQLITASVLTIPGIAMVLIAVFTGQFSRKAETTKYAVFYEEPEPDFWEQDERYRTAPPAQGAGGGQAAAAAAGATRAAHGRRPKGGAS